MKLLAPLSLCLALLPLAAGCGSRGASAAVTRSLTVIIVDEESGAPVDGVRVSLLVPGIDLPVRTTGVDGKARWTSATAFWAEEREDGRTLLRVDDTRDRYARQETDLGWEETESARGDVPAAKADEVIVELRRGAWITLTVRGADGEVIPARLTIWSAGNKRVETLETSDSGPTRIGPLPAGPTKVFVAAGGCVTRTLDLTVPRKGGDLGEVKLAPGGSTLVGRVERSLEVQPTEAYFRFAGAGLTASVEADGRFAFEGLPETEGSLVLRREGRELFSKEVAIDRRRVDLGLLKP